MGVYTAGTLGILLIGLMGLYIAWNQQRACVYGRATIFYFSLFWVIYASIRVGIITESMSRETAGEINGVIALLFSIIIGSLLMVHGAQHWQVARFMRRIGK